MKKLTLLLVLALIIQGTVFSQGCSPLEFSTQAEIDNFQINYPGCTEIEWTLTISGGDITNLNGLSVVTSIGQDLRIENNGALASLTGLDNVTSIGRGISIDNNDALTSLTGLDNVTSVGEWFIIRDNDALTSLTGLDNVTSIGDLTISYNNVLTSLTGLDNVTSVGGDLYIGDNDALTTLTGLGNVTSIGIELKFYGNDALTSLAGLDNLTAIGERLTISQNNALTSLTGLDNVTSIGVTYPYGGQGVLISYNDALTSLTGLDNVTSIVGGINIMGNDALTSLTSLANVTSIGGQLSIRENNALTSLTGLDNVYLPSSSYLAIYKNLLLSTCEVQSICDYLLLNPYLYDIYNNASGCNSPAEVEEACWTGVSNLNFESEFSIYPNPATNEIFIESTNGLRIEEIIVYNQLGQNVLQTNEIKESIDISTLGQGIYIIELSSKDQKFRQKLIIE